MKHIVNIAAAAAVLLCGVPSVAVAQSKAPAAAPAGKCAGFARQWKGIEYKLANNEAEGITDNSAPRATMRAIQDSNELARAAMLLDLMKAGGCPLPSAPPSGFTYMLPAMECQTEILKGVKDSPKCNRDSWTPMGN